MGIKMKQQIHIQTEELNMQVRATASIRGWGGAGESIHSVVFLLAAMKMQLYSKGQVRNKVHFTCVKLTALQGGPYSQQ